VRLLKLIQNIFFALLLSLISNSLFAQVPAVTYVTPQIVPTGSTFSALPSNSSAGAVAALTSYGTATALTATNIKGAEGLAVDASGNVYVCNFNSTTVFKYTAGAGTAASFITGLTSPTGIVFDLSGNCYVLSSAGVIKKYPSTGGATPTSSFTLSSPGTTYGLAIDASNNLYITSINGSTYQVYKFNTTSNTQSTFIASGGALNQPAGVAVDAAGNVYVSNLGGSVLKYNSAGTITTPNPFASGFTSPYAITIDKGGYIYVADYITGTGNIKVYNSSSNVAIATITNTAGFCDGLTVDGKGNLYTANYVATGGSVSKYAPKGGYFIDKNLPAGLTFDGTTGIISGTPTTVTAAATYTVNAYNATGINTTAATINLTVSAPPAISYPATVTYPAGTAVSLLPTSTGGAVPGNTYATVSLSAGKASGAAGSNASSLGGPTGITVVGSGTAYIADKVNNLIRKLTGGTLSTLAGTTAPGHANGTGTAATFSSPSDITSDAAGNLYIADLGNNQIRKIITVTAAVTTLAGSTTAGNANLTGAAASFKAPSGITFDPFSGNFYVADRGNNEIRQITPAGVVTLVAGSSSSVAGHTDGTGSGATFNGPSSVAVDGAGNIYVADKYNNEIRKISAGGVVTTLAGDYTVSPAASVDGIGSAANFNAPDGITVDRSGNIYVSEGLGNKIRMITPAGVVSTIAGSGVGGHASGVGVLATFSGPTGLDIDPSTGNVLVADSASNEIRQIIGTGYSISPTVMPPGLTFTATTGKISGTPTISTGPTTYTITGFNIVGSSVATISVTTVLNSPSISYTSPASLLVNTAVGTAPNPSLAPTLTGGTVPTITAYSTVTTFVASGTNINNPRDIVSDGAGNFFEADFGGNAIYLINSTGSTATLIAGGTVGEADGNGTLAKFNGPTGITYDGSTYLYIVDNGGNTIRQMTVTSPYTVNTIAGISGTATETNNATGTAATFNKPYGIAYDGSSFLYVTDNGGNTIRKVSTTAPFAVTTLAGAGGTGAELDGNGTAAKFNGPAGVAYDGSNFLYVTDEVGNTIRQVSTTGPFAVTTFAGSGTAGSANGTGTAATFKTPYGIAFDAAGELLVADEGNAIIRKITTPAAVVTTLAGSGATGEGNAIGTAATFTAPFALTTDNLGNAYIGDNITATSTIRKILLTGYTISPAILPTGLTFNLTGANAGAITGTVSVSSPATNYTITAYNANGGGTFVLNLTAYKQFRWVGGSGTGTTKTDWNTAANWNPATVPSNADQAQFGVVAGAISNMPIIPTGTTIPVGSIVMGTLATTTPAPVITVNGALNASGDITFASTNTGATTTSMTAKLTGSGAITANNVNVTASSGTGAYRDILASSVTSLGLSGNVTVTSSVHTNIQNAAFNVTGGTTSIGGNLVYVNGGATNAIADTISTGTLALTGTIKTPALGASTLLVNSGTLKLANTDPLSTLGASPATNTITLNGGTIEYSGANQTVYSNTGVANLAGGGLSYKSIAFSGSGIKTVSSGNLNISNDFTNSLVSDSTTTFVDLSNPTVNFNGTTQSLSDASTKANHGIGTTFYTVNFSGAGTKTMTSGMFNVDSQSILTMSGTNTLTKLDAGAGHLTLLSDTNGTATIPTMNGPSIIDTVNVQRLVTGGAGMRGYRLLSSPVYAGTDLSSNKVYSLNYIANSCYITGTTVTTGGIDKVGNPTLFLFRENVTPNSQSFITGNFRGVASMGTGGTTNVAYTMAIDGGPYNVPVGNGFLFFFRGDRNAAPITTETITSYIPTNTTLSARGILNQGNITVHNWFTPGVATLLYTNTTLPAPGNAAIQGYNLVGNPYPSSIRWTLVYGGSSNVSASVYEFNPITNHYGTYVQGSGAGTNGFGDTIVCGQGFFVLAANASAALNFSESNKISAQPSTLLMGLPVGGTLPQQQQYMHLKMIKDAINYDDVIIAFKPGTDTKYSIHEDGLHLTGNSPPETLATLSSDSVSLAVNYMPLPKATGQTIGLLVDATASGVYTFSRTELVGIPALYQIWLKDNLLKDSLDLRANTTYSFTIDKSNPATFGNSRFQIVLREDPALGLHLLDFGADKVTGVSKPQVLVSWKVENEANYTTFYVQRSTDGGLTFQSIGSLQSDGSGTYSFVDKSPVLTQDQYRLQLSDADNNLTYSKIIIVEYAALSNSNLFTISLYPNPAHDVVNMTIAGPTVATTGSYTITITNSSGTVVKTATSAQPTWQNNISDLLPGTYFIQVLDNNTKTVIGRNKFVKI